MKRGGAVFNILKTFCREEKKHVLHASRIGKKRYLSDYEIISNSQYPNEYPSNEIPIMEAEVSNEKSRRASEWLYENYQEKCNFDFFNFLDNWHRNLVWFDKNEPVLNNKGWIAPNATVIGNVVLQQYVSIWYGAIIRADLSQVLIGHYTNIQDGAIITTDDKSVLGNYHSDVQIGDHCTIGHGAKLHACKLGNDVTIGMGATVLEGAVIEEGAVIAAGAVVAPGVRVPHKEMWAGVPAKFKRHVGKIEYLFRRQAAHDYYSLAERHASHFTTTGRIHKEVEQVLSDMDKNIPVEEEQPEEHWNVWRKMGPPGQEAEKAFKQQLDDAVSIGK